MTEELRFDGKLLSAVVSRTAGRWFVSISVDIPDKDCGENQAQAVVGIDLGVTKLATLSGGMVFENPRATRRYEKELRRRNKSLARKRKGSYNHKKAGRALAKLHYRIGCCRKDVIHKMTSWIASRYSGVCIEDLHVKGMVRNRHLAKSVSDASFGEIRRQLAYKVRDVFVVDRFFPSTKLCPQCGERQDIPLSKRVFECACGYGPIDRDLHAAQNLLRAGCPDIKPVEIGALALAASLAADAKLLSAKQEVC